MIEKPVMLLPEPDSPTRPMTSPRFRLKETPSTAFTTPARAWKKVARSATSRSGVSVMTWPLGSSEPSS